MATLSPILTPPLSAPAKPVDDSGGVDLNAMVTHRFSLDQIEEAYELFTNQRDGVPKVAITP